MASPMPTTSTSTVCPSTTTAASSTAMARTRAVLVVAVVGRRVVGKRPCWEWRWRSTWWVIVLVRDIFGSISHGFWRLLCLVVVIVLVFRARLVPGPALMALVVTVRVSATTSTSPWPATSKGVTPGAPSCVRTPRCAEGSGAIGRGPGDVGNMVCCVVYTWACACPIGVVRVKGVDKGPEGLLVVVVVVVGV